MPDEARCRHTVRRTLHRDALLRVTVRANKGISHVVAPAAALPAVLDDPGRGRVAAAVLPVVLVLRQLNLPQFALAWDWKRQHTAQKARRMVGDGRAFTLLCALPL